MPPVYSFLGNGDSKIFVLSQIDKCLIKTELADVATVNIELCDTTEAKPR